MSELLAFYQAQATAIPNASIAVAKWREKALANFLKRGLPTHKTEAWKYTRIDSFARCRFLPQETVSPSVSDSPVYSSFSVYQQTMDNAIKGVVVMPLLTALSSEYASLIEQHIGKIACSREGFGALNAATFHQGVFVYVPAGVAIETPLRLTHEGAGVDKSQTVRHVIILEKGASLTLIEDYSGDTEVSYFTNTVSEVFLSPSARLNHYKIQREGNQAYHVGHVWVSQQANSDYQSHVLSLGAKWSRSDLTIRLGESGATCMMNGLYVLGDNQHCDHHTAVHHDVSHCQSAQDYKGIVIGHSRAVFNGQVIVLKGADKTVATQKNKNLLLSTQAEVDTKPELQIFADDVICSHGATVGQLDEDALFYLQARGISFDEARTCLIQAFAIDNIDKINDETMRAWMGQLINQKLG